MSNPLVESNLDMRKARCGSIRLWGRSFDGDADRAVPGRDGDTSARTDIGVARVVFLEVPRKVATISYDLRSSHVVSRHDHRLWAACPRGLRSRGHALHKKTMAETGSLSAGVVGAYLFPDELLRLLAAIAFASYGRCCRAEESLSELLQPFYKYSQPGRSTSGRRQGREIREWPSLQEGQIDYL